MLRSAAIAFCLTMFAQVSAAAPHLVTRSTSAMGTEVRISIYCDDEDEPAAARAAERAFEEIKRLEALMTTWKEDSEVSRINAAAGTKAIKVSDETLEVIQMAERSSKLSG